MIESPIFTPCKIGPITLRNRVIRSAAFENMAYNNSPSKDLFDYHTAVARGGVGMTTIAYAAVCQSGLSFNGQLWMREEIVPELKKLTDAIHAEGAKASIQLGHCGNMTHRATCGCMPVGASSGFNLYSPTFVRGLKKEEIYELVKDFGKSMSFEMRPYGVGVTTVCPAAIATPLYKLSPRLMKLGVKIGVINTPEWLVKRALKALFKKKPLIKPGFMNYYLPPLIALLPRGIEDKIWKRLK